METDVKFIREHLMDYQPFWKESIEYLGSCCHKGVIPVDAITRYCIVEWDKRPELVINYTDHSVNIDHYRLLGPYYHKVLQWFFGDRKYLPPDMGEASISISKKEMADCPSDLQKLLTHQKKQRDYRIRTSKNRNGIEIIRLKEK